MCAIHSDDMADCLCSPFTLLVEFARKIDTRIGEMCLCTL